MRILVYYLEEKTGQEFAEKLEIACSRLEIDYKIILANKEEELIKYAKKGDFNIFFMHIEKVDDIWLAKNILKIDEKFFLNFVSSNDELVFEAFKCHPFMYLRTPYLDNELLKLMYEIKHYIYKNRAIKSFNINGNILTLDLMKVKYAEVVGNYLYLYEDDRTTKIRQTIGESEKLWRNLGFVRVHMSYLVNCKYIKEYSSKMIVLFDGTEIHVSRSYSKETQQFIIKFQLENKKMETL